MKIKEKIKRDKEKGNKVSVKKKLTDFWKVILSKFKRDKGQRT